MVTVSSWWTVSPSWLPAMWLCHHDCSCVICLVMSWWLCHHDGLCHPVDCQLCGCAIMSMAMSSVWPCYHDYVICIDMSLWWTVTQLTVSCVTMSSWLCHLDRYVIFMMDCHHHTLLSCQRTFIYIYTICGFCAQAWILMMVSGGGGCSGKFLWSCWR